MFDGPKALAATALQRRSHVFGTLLGDLEKQWYDARWVQRFQEVVLPLQLRRLLQKMKKIMGLLVAVIALSVVMSGCSKPKETTTPAATAGETAGATAGETAGAPAATAGAETAGATAGATTGK